MCVCSPSLKIVGSLLKNLELINLRQSSIVGVAGVIDLILRLCFMGGFMVYDYFLILDII
jgi:hypothetical protein